MSPIFLALAWLQQKQPAAPFASEIAAFRAEDKERTPAKGQVLFIGSSSFTRWKTAQAQFPAHPLINRAFGGSTLLDVIRYVDDVVTPYHPRQVVLYCGENDFAGDPKLDPSTVTGRFKTVFRLVRNRTHDAPFAYVSMKPSPSRWSLAPKFKKANLQIEKFLKGQKGAAYIDVWPVMLGADGKPDPTIFVEDNLHMNEEGYRRWVPLIEPVLK